VSIDKRKTHEKKLARLEEDLKVANAAVSGAKFRINIMVSLSYMVAYYYLNNFLYRGVIGRVPFVPMGPVRGFVGRGLKTDDARAVGFAFIYALSSMALKVNVQKALGFAPPRSGFSAWEESKKRSEQYAEKFA